MPKPSPVHGLAADTPACEAARRILVSRLHDLLRFEAPVLEGSADGVHDMRVASRRLRAAISLFGRKGKLDEAELEVKRLADALGSVRDLDVAAEWLDKQLGKQPENAPARTGIERLRDEQLAARQSPDLELRRVLFRFVSEVAPRLDRKLAQAHFPGRLGGHRIRARLSNAIAGVGRWQQSTLESPDGETAHRLRIRAKKLRYRAEILEPALPEVVPPLLERLTHLQELLGDLHDCDVRRPLVERFLVTAEPQERAGALELLQKTLSDRDRLATELLVELKAWQEAGVVDDLRRRLE